MCFSLSQLLSVCLSCFSLSAFLLRIAVSGPVRLMATVLITFCLSSIQFSLSSLAAEQGKPSFTLFGESETSNILHYAFVYFIICYWAMSHSQHPRKLRLNLGRIIHVLLFSWLGTVAQSEHELVLALINLYDAHRQHCLALDLHLWL